MKLQTALVLSLLAGCGGLPKAGPQAALYDFGITASERPLTTLPIRLEAVEALPGLNGSEIRYRLAYQNPARVFAYTESRWSAPPDKLLAQRLQKQFLSTGPSPCTLRITLETFDHVLDTPQTSRGIVRLTATLSRSKKHEPPLQTHVSTELPATSADARGGVAALTAAANLAAAQVTDWAAAQCHGNQ